ncbi:MAG: sugar ABC transporter substrate-binding protein [Fibrella sp.]|nr:sugar ABC transporter substrate-binding protein [Armatimonadota bacterium]
MVATDVGNKAGILPQPPSDLSVTPAGSAGHAPIVSRRAVLRSVLGAAPLLLTGSLGCNAPQSVGGKKRVQIRYMAWGNPEQIALERQIAAEFEKLNPHIHVHFFMVPGSSYADKLQLMLASRTAPDVMRADRYYFPALARKEYFYPLDPLVAREKPGFLDDFLPLVLDEGRWQGKLFGLNVLFGSVMVYYNKKLFAAAGLADPYQLYKQGRWDWETFVQNATALTERTNGRTTQYGANMVTFPMNASVIWNHGGDFLNREMTRMTIAEDEGAIRGFQEYADLRWKHKCVPTPSDNALSQYTFESGKIAMNWGWAGDSPRYRKNIKAFDWDIVPTPSGPAGDATVIKGNQLAMYRDTRHPEESWEFMKFMTGPDVELLLGGKLRRTVPTRLSVRNDPRYLEADQAPFHTDVFLESVRRGRTLPIDWRYQEWTQEFTAATESLFNIGTETARQAMTEATRRVNNVLSSEEGF